MTNFPSSTQIETKTNTKNQKTDFPLRWKGNFY